MRMQMANPFMVWRITLCLCITTCLSLKSPYEEKWEQWHPKVIPSEKWVEVGGKKKRQRFSLRGKPIAFIKLSGSIACRKAW